MRLRSLQNGLKLLLAAVVLLGCVIPPAVQHVHADGDKAHDHRHHASHSAGHRHPHGHEMQTTKAEETPPHRHLHLLGFDFWWPIGEFPDTPGSDDEMAGDDLILVRVLETEAVSASTPLIDRLIIAFPVWSTISGQTIAQVLLRGDREGPTAQPLCDSARCERSGVLLI